MSYQPETSILTQGPKVRGVDMACDMKNTIS